MFTKQKIDVSINFGKDCTSGKVLYLPQASLPYIHQTQDTDGEERRLEHFIAYVTHWSVYINMQGDKETLSGFYKSPQAVINKVLSIYNQVWYASILSIN